MDGPFTGADLRLAAKQAMALAFMDFRRDTRETLLRTADRLLAEADELEKDDLKFKSSQSGKVVDLMQTLQNRMKNGRSRETQAKNG